MHYVGEQNETRKSYGRKQNSTQGRTTRDEKEWEARLVTGWGDGTVDAAVVGP